jgi:hypothetical protein
MNPSHDCFLSAVLLIPAEDSQDSRARHGKALSISK